MNSTNCLSLFFSSHFLKIYTEKQQNQKNCHSSLNKYSTFAVIGAISGAFNHFSYDENLLLSIFKHSLSEGALEGIQGGNILHGMMLGAVSAAGNHYINENAKSLGRAGKIASSAVLGGTVSELGGGKFANGAITGAFSMMFNDMMHSKNNRKLQKMKKKIEEDGVLSFKEARKWYREGDGSSITVDADKIDLNFLDVSSLKIGEPEPVQTWMGGISQGLVYGGITVVYQGNYQVEIRPDRYDFEMHSWSSFREGARNIETLIARPVHGKGTPFPIYFRGLNTIHPNTYIWRQFSSSLYR